uniref:Uncharacterized protein n=1 Tax=Pyxicephalus adspersus TaxID=30357 RepID=A0AAV3ALZ4_PYXAD|nr:TPA: hypothetical protein GDO54_010486 [Pyxicephalus adspersus]
MAKDPKPEGRQNKDKTPATERVKDANADIQCSKSQDCLQHPGHMATNTRSWFEGNQKIIQMLLTQETLQSIHHHGSQDHPRRAVIFTYSSYDSAPGSS